MKYFENYVNDNEITHYYIYPRRPQMNTYVERFNGVIQSQFVDYAVDSMDEIGEFNDILMDCLLWYNTKKIHLSLEKKTPIDYYVEKHALLRKKSNMYWNRTLT